jgi:hypothetical protein
MRLDHFIVPIVLACALALPPLARATPPGPPETSDLGAAIARRFGPDVRVTWNDARTAPKRLSGLAVATAGSDVGERVRTFLAAHRDVIGLQGDVRVDEVRKISLPDTRLDARLHAVRLTPLWHGLPIDGRTLVVRLDEHQRVTALSSDLGPLVVPEPGRTLDAGAISAIVQETYAIVAASPPDKVVLARGTAGRVAWKVAVSVVPLQAHFHVWLDAETGAILKEAPAAFDQLMSELPRRAEVAP